jgi:hypothetical protein
MNFVNKFVSNLEQLDKKASNISKETDGDLKETIAKNLPIVTNKVKEITARSFIGSNSGSGRSDEERKRRESLEDAKRLESSEEILRALASSSSTSNANAIEGNNLLGDEKEEEEERQKRERCESLCRQTELLLPALRALEADVDALQYRANEQKFREEEEAKKQMAEARQHENESMRLERLLERERNARMEMERFEEERVMAMKNDQGECEKTTRECRLAKEERRKEREKAEREKETAEKEVIEIERRIVEAEERLRVSRAASTSASSTTTTSTIVSAAAEEGKIENAEERERQLQLKHLVEEAKRELKMLDEQIYEHKQSKARYRENSDDYCAEMQRRLRSLDEQLQFRRMKLAGLESQKADAERELARYRNENNGSHRVSVLDEFNVHPAGGERGEKGTQRRRAAAAAATHRNDGAVHINDNDDKEALKKANTTRRQKLDASISLVLRLLRDSPSVRGIFVLFFAFVHVYVFVSSAKHALRNDPNHREGKAHH